METKMVLSEQIEKLRALLQAEAAQKGLRHHKVIEISQELDKKIVLYQIKLFLKDMFSCVLKAGPF
jgi:hypothetical protein